MLQSLPLPSRIKENIPIERRNLWKLWFPICRSLRVMSWRHRGIYLEAPIISDLRANANELASGFCLPEPLPMHMGIKGRQVHPLIRFLLRSRVDEKCADLHKPFISYLFLVGVTVQSVESLSAAIPLGTSTKRANSKRANHGRSQLFQDAIPSVSFWLRSFPVHGWRTRSLSLGFQHAKDAGAFFPGGAWGADEVVDGPFHCQKPLVRLLPPHYPQWQGCQGVRGHSPGGESDRGAPVPTKRRHLEEPSASPVQSL